LCKFCANLLFLHKRLQLLDFTIDIRLDARRAKRGNRFPVKLRVYSASLQQAKLYKIGYDLTEKEFHSTWQTQKPRSEFKQTRMRLEAIKSKANEIAFSISPFNFNDFEKKFYSNTGSRGNVINFYSQAIAEYETNGQRGTASNYQQSLKSIQGFVTHEKKRSINRILFTDISPSWLKKYERYMLDIKKSSRTTIGIYLRPLRAIFNTAISEKVVDPDFYPFGKRKYQIPASQNTKKALSPEELAVLFHSKPQTPEQQKAKDFWFFSYSCNGMNVKDIALLRFKNIQDDQIIFYRAKTINTSKTNLKPVRVMLTEFAMDVIKKYRNDNTSPENLIFGVINDNQPEEKNFNRVKNFTRFINQHIKKLSEANNLPKDISTYWARHSFATNAVRNGASMEFVSEALSHSNLKTTMSYFAGFEDKEKKILSEKMMDF